jgi:hypothetical protein
MLLNGMQRLYILEESLFSILRWFNYWKMQTVLFLLCLRLIAACSPSSKHWEIKEVTIIFASKLLRSWLLLLGSIEILHRVKLQETILGFIDSSRLGEGVIQKVVGEVMLWVFLGWSLHGGRWDKYLFILGRIYILSKEFSGLSTQIVYLLSISLGLFFWGVSL